MPHLLILNGNPKADSFGKAICDRYQQSLPPGWSVTRLDLHTLQFDPLLQGGYEGDQPLETDLQILQAALLQAEQLLLVTPIWWGGVPAKLKGLFDRTFLPGFAFRYDGNSPWPQPCLTGKQAQLILTMDMPADMLAIQAAPVLSQLGHFTLAFSGMTLAEPLLFGSIQASDETQRTHWLQQVQDCAARLQPQTTATAPG